MSNFKHGLLNWMDVIVVFFLAVLPPLSRSIFYVLDFESQRQWVMDQLLVALIVNSLQISLPILFIMHLRNVRWENHGFVKLRPAKDLAIATGLTFLCYLAYYLTCIVLAFSGQDYSKDVNPFQGMSNDESSSRVTLFLIFAASAANGFTEELAMRSYLIPRISKLTNSDASAVILTSAIFAIYHMYQGRYGIISALFVGLVLGTYFARTKRFWPIFIAHAFMDVIPLLIMSFPPE